MSHALNSRLPGWRTGPGAKESNLWVRARMIQAIRRFFESRGYLEVETPQLISAPAPEVHIDALGVGNRYLHTSPELCMKRLLAAGCRKIFQIGKCFRQGERGRLHLPEFSLLEWYRAGTDYTGLMCECEALINEAALQLGRETIDYQGAGIRLGTPWERMTVEDAFKSYASLSLEEALKKRVFDETMVREIEPRLGLGRPTFLCDYPASLAALAKISPRSPRVAERFELYLGGLEIANAFTELTDAEEQRARFERDSRERRLNGKEAYPLPERFLAALPYMPEAAGIALGIDRLAMIFTDSAAIDEVVCFAPEEV